MLAQYTDAYKMPGTIETRFNGQFSQLLIGNTP